MWYALYAFAGLGLELLLLGLVEPVLFGGTASSDYSDTQRILHWLLTILCWGAMIALLTHFSKRKLQFDPLARRPFSKKGLGAAAVLAAVCVLLNALDWGTLKIVGEWQSKGALLFFFQYVYYLFEIGLVFLIVAFGQRFAEGLLRKESRIPFGGLVLCFTWGIIHMLSQGEHLHRPWRDGLRAALRRDLPAAQPGQPVRLPADGAGLCSLKPLSKREGYF